MNNTQLMRDAGSETGAFDPEAPAHWQWVLANGKPEERALAWIKSKTVHMSRSAYCVDEHGKPLYVASMAAELGWTPHTAENLVSTLVKQGRIRLKGKRIWYRADVPKAEGRTEGENFSFVQTPFPPYVLEAIGLLSSEKRATWERVKPEFLAWREAVVADALAGVRSNIIEPVEDSMFAWLGADKKRLPKKKKGRLPLQIQLLEQPSFVQTLGIEFEQTNENGLHKPENRSVQTGVSLLPSDTDTDISSVSQSRVVSTEQEKVPAGTSLPAANGSAPSHPTKTLSTMAGEHAQVHAALITELSGRLPGETPSPALCAQIDQRLRGAPLAHLVNRIQARAEKIRSYGMCGTLADEVGQAWLAGKAARDRAAIANKELEARRHTRAVEEARRTLDDSRADEQEKQLAREILGIATRTAKGGS